jgi:ABC-type nickel/cobalt efflux system permease component RcnA
MTLAISKGAAPASIAFAFAMTAGVILTLAAGTLAATLFRAQMDHMLKKRLQPLRRVSRAIEGITGCAPVASATVEILG